MCVTCVCVNSWCVCVNSWCLSNSPAVTKIINNTTFIFHIFKKSLLSLSKNSPRTNLCQKAASTKPGRTSIGGLTKCLCTSLDITVASLEPFCGFIFSPILKGVMQSRLGGSAGPNVCVHAGTTPSSVKSQRNGPHCLGRQARTFCGNKVRQAFAARDSSISCRLIFPFDTGAPSRRVARSSFRSSSSPT